MSYDPKNYRVVKHGIEDASAKCRHCEFDEYEGDVRTKARNHAKKTGHTVDYYQENWTEYTSYVQD